MPAEEQKEATPVYLPNGKELGSFERFILDPNTNEVTHIVVRGNGRFSGDRLVPFGNVHTDEHGRLVLEEELPDLEQLPPFEENHFVKLQERIDGYPAYYWYPPFGHPGHPGYGLRLHGFRLASTGENLPSGTLSLETGIAVLSSDGVQVGVVRELLVDEASHQVTHFLVSEDLSFKEQKLVPVKWVRSVDEEEVRLAVTSQLLEDLPTYEAE